MGESGLEYQGHPCSLPALPPIVGSCNICGGDIYDYEAICCNCDRIIHQGCPLECLKCHEKGCKSCMVEDDEGNWFCKISECKEEYYKEYEDEIPN